MILKHIYPAQCNAFHVYHAPCKRVAEKLQQALYRGDIHKHAHNSTLHWELGKFVLKVIIGKHTYLGKISIMHTSVAEMKQFQPEGIKRLFKLTRKVSNFPVAVAAINVHKTWPQNICVGSKHKACPHAHQTKQRYKLNVRHRT